MRKVILYSGGFDSTCVLADLVKSASENDTIVAVTIQHQLTGVSKLRREYESQIMAIRELRKKFPDVTLIHEIIQVNSQWNSGETFNSRGLSQPIFWICNLIPLLEDGDEVYIGYNKDDQALLHEDNIRGMWNHMLKIQEYKNIQINFPLKYFTKTDVLKYIIEEYDFLIEACISCENDFYKGNEVCGECVPCTHLKQTLFNLSICSTDIVANRAKSMLRELFKIEITITDLKQDKVEKSVEEPYNNDNIITVE